MSSLMCIWYSLNLRNLVISQSLSVIANRLSFIALLVIISLCYKRLFKKTNIINCWQHCTSDMNDNTYLHSIVRWLPIDTDLLQLFKNEGTHDAVADNQWEKANVGEEEGGKGTCKLATRNHNKHHQQQVSFNRKLTAMERVNWQEGITIRNVNNRFCLI